MIMEVKCVSFHWIIFFSLPCILSFFFLLFFNPYPGFFLLCSLSRFITELWWNMNEWMNASAYWYNFYKQHCIQESYELYMSHPHLIQVIIQVVWPNSFQNVFLGVTNLLTLMELEGIFCLHVSKSLPSFQNEFSQLFHLEIHCSFIPHR